MLTARQPPAFQRGSPNVARLFPNHRAVEEEYFTRTRLFPIMHTVVVRRAILERDPWVAASLFDAFSRAKARAYEDLHETDALRFTLPWLMDEAERTERVMGKDFWPYGIEANGHVVQSLIRYSHEQGLAAREIPIEEIFAPVRL